MLLKKVMTRSCQKLWNKVFMQKNDVFLKILKPVSSLPV